MLDKDFGVFPHVTRSNTTSKNIQSHVDDVYYVTRSYLTRHGNGPILSTGSVSLKNNEKETNVENDHQGQFRTAPLDPQMINYAITCDINNSPYRTRNLVITCMDQHEIDVTALLDRIDTKFAKVFLSYGPSLTDIKQFK